MKAIQLLLMVFCYAMFALFVLSYANLAGDSLAHVDMLLCGIMAMFMGGFVMGDLIL